MPSLSFPAVLPMDALRSAGLHSIYLSNASRLEMEGMADFIIGGIATALILGYLVYALFRAEDL